MSARPDVPAAVEPTEVELKLHVDRPSVIRRLLADADPDRLAGFRAAGPLHLVRVTDRYLDTDELNGALAARGMRARLRRSGSEITITVKRSGLESAGVTTRVEMVGPATRSRFAARWPESQARDALLAAVGRRRLVEIAALRQARLTRVLERAGTRIEVSLDRLDALAGARSVARRHELEAELLAGDEDALGELGAALHRIAGVGLPLGSKLRFAIDAAVLHRREQALSSGR